MRQEYEKVLREFKNIVSSQRIEYDNLDRSNLIEGKIVFVSGWRLEFMEFESDRKHKYRFHLMDEDNKLVKRWDTAPHHQKMENFPFHVHKGEEIESTEELEGREILRKACNCVLNSL